MANPIPDSATPARRRAVHSSRMKLSIKRNATIDDLETTPEGMNGQLIDGTLYMTTRPAIPHAVAITAIIGELRPVIRDRKKGWVILFEPELKLGDHVLIGDISGWRRERVPILPDAKRMELAPDWVCEGLSPSTARIDRGRKREIYAQAGVSHLWFVDPVHQTLEILALKRRAYEVVGSAGGNDRGRFPPFDTIELDLSVFWQR